ncbi:MAG: RNA polymerase sigma-70 factor [Bacteroidales bacterium]|nr:RNA polymerase sigma-70 factor [Candidatus Cryptobacteroides aphodequi]
MAQTSSEEDFRTLYLLYYAPLYRYISLYIHSAEEAKELASDIFIALWKQRGKLPEISNFSAYVYKMARNLMMNSLRTKKGEPVDINDLPIDLFAGTASSPEDDIISEEQMKNINSAIEALPPKCKITFKLVREDNLKYKEAADVLGISIKTVEAHLATALKKIQDKIRNK